jgi:predicted nucleic acid-binding protein
MVSRAVLLDSGPLGLASNPKRSGPADDCNRWLRGLVAAGVRVVVPEVADYEVRRELLRAGKVGGVSRLEALAGALEYLPITTAAMRRAAELWAEARRAGRPTAGEESLDADVILAAQALTLGADEVVVATTNAAHLSRYVGAAVWADVTWGQYA